MSLPIANNERRLTFLNKDTKHLLQLTENDCGVACLKMALNYIYKKLDDAARNEHLASLDNILENLHLKNHSLWTIDIAHVCSIKKIQHIMYTISLGVQENYANEEFYCKDKNFDQEKLRVNTLFSNANELGINVIKESITLDHIKTEIGRKSACIALIDAKLLKGKNINIHEGQNEEMEFIDDEYEYDSQFDDLDYSSSSACCLINPFGKVKNQENMSKSGSELDKIVESMLVDQKNSNKYCGHFIYVCGYNDNKNLIYYKNPASNYNFSYTSYLNFEIARKSFGTDQDILFIQI